METSLSGFLKKFFDFRVVGKKVIIPYWRNKLEKKIFGPCGGKGTPEEIKKAVFEAAKQAKLDLKAMTGEEIYLFMKKKRIGLDCSGFAYQLLNFLDYQKGGDGLENTVVGVNGMGIRKTNADSLTNEVNSLPVADYQQVKIGDLIRTVGGKHVLLIVDIGRDQITYAHIGQETSRLGPHLAKIIIADPTKGIEAQKWEEKISFDPGVGDGIKRLKIWA